MNYTQQLKKQEKLLTDTLKFSVSKCETRPHLNHVTYDKELKALCSTDGHKLTALKSRYHSGMAGKLINPIDFTISNREFPRLKMFSKDDKKFTHSFDIKFDKKYYVKWKRNEKITRLHFYDDGEISHELIEGKKRLISINAEFIKPLIGHNLTVNIQGELKPMYIDLNEQDFYIIMPVIL